MRIWHALALAVLVAGIIAAIVTVQVCAAENPTGPQPIIFDGIRYELKTLGVTVERNLATREPELCWIVTVVVQGHPEQKTIKLGFLAGDDSIPPDRIVWESSYRDGIFYRTARCNGQLMMKVLEKYVKPADQRPEPLGLPDYVVQML